MRKKRTYEIDMDNIEFLDLIYKKTGTARHFTVNRAIKELREKYIHEHYLESKNKKKRVTI